MKQSFLTEDTKAIILLCAVFGKDHLEKPLGIKEYSSLVRWLVREDMRPGDLLQKENIQKASIGSEIDEKRLLHLVSRGVQLGFAVEEWQRAGIWIISRSDSDYPVRLRKHLKDKAPPLLFCIGNRSLIKGGGIAVVGSRNVDEEGKAFAENVAELCAANLMPVVSGGARGVDIIAMNAAIEAGGTALGILSDKLLKKSLERKNRHAIAGGTLLLISPYHPGASFNVGLAMGRNKLIYAMADYGLVVSAEHEKGGTWSGAREELRKKASRPVFIRISENAPEGNKKLLEFGALPWPDQIDMDNFREKLLTLSKAGREQKTEENPEQENPLKPADIKENQETEHEPDKKEVHEKKEVHDIKAKNSPEPNEKDGEKKPGAKEKNASKPEDLIYEAVLPIILNELNIPRSPSELAKALNLNKKQLDAWLKKAVSENEIVKKSRPLRYEIKDPELF